MRRVAAAIASVALLFGSCRFHEYTQVDKSSFRTTTLVYMASTPRPQESTIFAYDADGRRDTIEEALVVYGARFEREPLGTELGTRPPSEWKYLVAAGRTPTRYVSSHTSGMTSQEQAALNGLAAIAADKQH
jgi:hypothetical protein